VNLNLIKRFLRASHLQSHELIHTKERRFICQTCDKRFYWATHLRSHETIYTGEPRFICQSCDKRFRSASNLRSHELIHTGERRFVCQTCDKIFSWVSNLRSHELIHTPKGRFVRQVDNTRCNQASYPCTHNQNYNSKRDGQTDPTHVEQVKGQLHVCCECDQLFYHRLNDFK